MLCVMRSFASIFCLLTPNWVAAQSPQDLLDSVLDKLDGEVIEIAGEIQDDGIDTPYIWLSGTDSFHQFEYSMRMSPSELRAVKKACSPHYDGRTCAIKGKAELDTSSSKGFINPIFLYITEVSEVVDFSDYKDNITTTKETLKFLELILSFK